MASTCINRSPFKAQCICNPGYAGNGKTVCDECGKTQVRPNLMRIVGGVNAIPLVLNFATDRPFWIEI